MSYTEAEAEISAYDVGTQMVGIGLRIILVEVEIVERAAHLDLSSTDDVGSCGLEERVFVGGLSRLGGVLS